MNPGPTTNGRVPADRLPPRPTTPPPPPPGPAGASQPVAPADAAAVEAAVRAVELDRRKAAAFDDLARWLAAHSGGAQYTDAMDPEWVVSMLKGRVGSMLADARDFRAGRRRAAFLRRTGW